MKLEGNMLLKKFCQIHTHKYAFFIIKKVIVCPIQNMEDMRTHDCALQIEIQLMLAELSGRFRFGRIKKLKVVVVKVKPVQENHAAPA